MKLLEVNYLRLYAIISIVIWHCFVCPLTCWQLIEPTIATRLIGVGASIIIPDANMPLFTFISGYLFYCLYQKNPAKYQDFKLFTFAKISRLVIPFFVIGTLVNISAPERYLHQIVWGEGSHLWFCMMLFWCFMLAWSEKKINSKWYSLSLLLICIGCFLYSRGSNWNMPKVPLGIHNALVYYNYFFFGEMAYKYKDKIMSYRLKGGIFTIGLYILCNVIVFTGIQYISGLASITRPFFFCAMLLTIVLWLVNTGSLMDQKWLTTFCAYSFGVYVFHEWLSWDIYHIPTVLSTFQQSPIIFASIFTIFDFILSWFLTHYLLKTKIGKFLLT